MDQLEKILSQLPSVIEASSRNENSLIIVALAIFVVFVFLFFKKDRGALRVAIALLVFLLAALIISATLVKVSDLQPVIPPDEPDPKISPPQPINPPAQTEGPVVDESLPETPSAEKPPINSAEPPETASQQGKDQICLDNPLYRTVINSKSGEEYTFVLVRACDDRGYLMQFTEMYPRNTLEPIIDIESMVRVRP
ncbi:MAG: hypothetical protein HC783_05650 [Rhodobacteraceae bacterium]|nr:hypothetical protein [Paracoccaceae bacterium]